MCDNRREDEKSFSIRKTSTNNGQRHIKDDNDDYHHKKMNSSKYNEYNNSQRTSNLDAKVYVGNVPTNYLTDRELLEFFKPFGKVSDIRVYKGYIFVQYDRADDARKLIKQAQNSLILKGNKLDILPAMEASSMNTKSPSHDLFNYDQKSFQQESSRSSRRHSGYDRHSTNYEPPRKRHAHNNYTDDQHRYSSTSITRHHNNDYGDSNERELNDDRGKYKSSSRICSNRSSNGSSSRKHENYYTTLIGPDNSRQTVECQIILVNPRQRGYGEEISSRLRCNGLVTSVILLREDYTLIEAIENATKEECLYGIIVMPMHEERRTASFHILHGQTEEHRNLRLEDGFDIILTNYASYKENLENEKSNNSKQRIIYGDDSNEYNQEEYSSSIGDKLPLSMLLCLLADGRQLTLDEIDRVLVYLLEKKSKMLILPPGTLPPLPAQYATSSVTHQTDLNNQKSNSLIENKSSNDLSSTIVEHIRQILSSNMMKSSTEQNCFDSFRDLIQNQEKNKELEQQQQQQQNTYSYQNSNTNSIEHVTPSFHYSSSTNQTNSPLKDSTLSQFLYPTSTQSQNLYQNSSAAHTAAKIFQAYSQFNSTPSILNQQQTRK